MVDIRKQFRNLNIHFESYDVILKRTVIVAAAIAVTSVVVFGIDTAVTSVISLIG